MTFLRRGSPNHPKGNSRSVEIAVYEAFIDSNDDEHLLRKEEKVSGAPSPTSQSPTRFGNTLLAPKSKAASHAPKSASKRGIFKPLKIAKSTSDRGSVSSSSMDIWKACRIGDIQYVSQTMHSNPDLLHLKLQGRTPLYLASVNGHSKLLKLLLSAGCMDDANETCYNNAANDACQTLLRQYRAVEEHMNVSDSALRKHASSSAQRVHPTTLKSSSPRATSIPTEEKREPDSTFCVGQEMTWETTQPTRRGAPFTRLFGKKKHSSDDAARHSGPVEKNDAGKKKLKASRLDSGDNAYDDAWSLKPLSSAAEPDPKTEDGVNTRVATQLSLNNVGEENDGNKTQDWFSMTIPQMTLPLSTDITSFGSCVLALLADDVEAKLPGEDVQIQSVDNQATTPEAAADAKKIPQSLASSKKKRLQRHFLNRSSKSSENLEGTISSASPTFITPWKKRFIKSRANGKKACHTKKTTPNRPKTKTAIKSKSDVRPSSCTNRGSEIQIIADIPTDKPDGQNLSSKLTTDNLERAIPNIAQPAEARRPQQKDGKTHNNGDSAWEVPSSSPVVSPWKKQLAKAKASQNTATRTKPTPTKTNVAIESINDDHKRSGVTRGTEQELAELRTENVCSQHALSSSKMTDRLESAVPKNTVAVVEEKKLLRHTGKALVHEDSSLEIKPLPAVVSPRKKRFVKTKSSEKTATPLTSSPMKVKIPTKSLSDAHRTNSTRETEVQRNTQKESSKRTDDSMVCTVSAATVPTEKKELLQNRGRAYDHDNSSLEIVPLPAVVTPRKRLFGKSKSTRKTLDNAVLYISAMPDSTDETPARKSRFSRRRSTPAFGQAMQSQESAKPVVELREGGLAVAPVATKKKFSETTFSSNKSLVANQPETELRCKTTDESRAATPASRPFAAPWNDSKQKGTPSKLTKPDPELLLNTPTDANIIAPVFSVSYAGKSPTLEEITAMKTQSRRKGFKLFPASKKGMHFKTSNNNARTIDNDVTDFDSYSCDGSIKSIESTLSRIRLRSVSSTISPLSNPGGEMTVSNDEKSIECGITTNDPNQAAKNLAKPKLGKLLPPFLRGSTKKAKIDKGSPRRGNKKGAPTFNSTKKGKAPDSENEIKSGSPSEPGYLITVVDSPDEKTVREYSPFSIEQSLERSSQADGTQTNASVITNVPLSSSPENASLGGHWQAEDVVSVACERFDNVTSIRKKGISAPWIQENRHSRKTLEITDSGTRDDETRRLDETVEAKVSSHGADTTTPSDVSSPFSLKSQKHEGMDQLVGLTTTEKGSLDSHLMSANGVEVELDQFEFSESNGAATTECKRPDEKFYDKHPCSTSSHGTLQTEASGSVVTPPRIRRQNIERITSQLPAQHGDVETSALMASHSASPTRKNSVAGDETSQRYETNPDFAVAETPSDDKPKLLEPEIDEVPLPSCESELQSVALNQESSNSSSTCSDENSQSVYTETSESSYLWAAKPEFLCSSRSDNNDSENSCDSFDDEDSSGSENIDGIVDPEDIGFASTTSSLLFDAPTSYKMIKDEMWALCTLNTIDTDVPRESF